MPVTITDRRLVWTQADTANWGGSTADTVYTTAPDPKELTGCLGFGVSQAEEYVYFTSTAVNLAISPGTLVYAWTLVLGTEQSTVNGGRQVLLGDGTNRIGFYIGGSDTSGFRHDEGTVNWQCLLIDTQTTASAVTEHEGTLASLNFNAISDIGTAYVVDSKALGGGDNCFSDVIFVGNEGIVITGGTGSFEEIAAADASNTNGASSYGICRKLGAGSYGLQGPLIFGDTGSLSCNFQDSGSTVTFEDRGIGTDKYSIKVEGNATGTTIFQLGEQVGTTTSGQNPTNIVVPTGVGAFFSASDADVDTVNIYGCTLSGFNRGIYFSTDPTNGVTHEIYGNIFSGCGQIDPGKTLFKNNSIVASTEPSGAVLFDTDTTSSNFSDNTFTSAGTGHAIYIAEAGTYEFQDHTFSGYATVDGSTGNEVLWNDSQGVVVINASGITGNISVRTTAGGTNTEVRVLAFGTNTELAGVENATDGVSGSREFTFSLSAGTATTIKVHALEWEHISLDFTVPGSATDLPVQQRFDRNYLNP